MMDSSSLMWVAMIVMMVVMMGHDRRGRMVVPPSATALVGNRQLQIMWVPV